MDGEIDRQREKKQIDEWKKQIDRFKKIDNKK